MNAQTNHTREVEDCIPAIRICPGDSCSFFVRRESALVGLRQCFYCDYSVFVKESSDIHQEGLCNYKLRRDEIDEKQMDSS